MESNKPAKDELLQLCGEIGPEDGIDPRDFFKPARKESHRKTFQLCHQVAETLNVELASMSEPPLSDLAVVSVEPAPDASHLLVLVAAQDPKRVLVEADVLSALNGSSGRFRAEVAAAISRKRVPQLSFRFLPSGSEEV